MRTLETMGSLGFFSECGKDLQIGNQSAFFKQSVFSWRFYPIGEQSEKNVISKISYKVIRQEVGFVVRAFLRPLEIV